ncbi:alpha/beta hydrolase [Verrucomicrobia bacterium]|nr:alpha/beta hydrolase [Verrucomicrobiota bacterium]
MKLLILIFLVVMAAPSAKAQRVYSDNPPKGKNYTYKEIDGVAREMEIFFPKRKPKKAVPGIIFFHGGGWGGGSREMFSYQCNYFASRGIVAATVTYRLANKVEKKAMQEGESYKRLCIPDAKSAIRWFKANASELGIDPNRVIVGGGSAGGHISLLATTNPGLNHPNDPKGFDTSVAAYVLFNPALSVGDSKDSEIDFMQHVKTDLPPAIVFFGSEDNWMKRGWNPAKSKMTFMGIKGMDMMIAEGQGHGFFNRQPWADLTLIAADKFLKKHGLIKGEPTLAVSKNGETLKVE